MIKELDAVVLVRDLPDQGLKPGDLGTVVFVHKNSAAYEVEFTTLAGDTIAVETLKADAIRPVHDDEIAHVRQVA
jgi:hypothetical protein